MWTRIGVIIFFLSGIFVANTSAQSYQVTASGYPGVGGWSIKSFICSAGQATGSSGVFSSIPTGSFSITFSPPFGSGYSDCMLSGTMQGCNGGGTGTATPCGGNGTSWGIALYVVAIIAIESGTSATGDYCEYEDITINATPGFPTYSWEYRNDTNGTWQSFSPGSGSSVTFGIQDIYGASYTSQRNKPIYFRYSSGCGPPTNAIGPYTFRPTPALIEASPINPFCHDGTDTLRVTGFSRDPVFEEVFDISIRKAGVNVVVKQIHNLTSADLPFDFTGMGHGDYEAYIEGFIPDPNDPNRTIPTGCGSIQYHPFAIDTPTQVKFAHVVGLPSCNTATTGIKNDGTITLTASGGKGTSYQYSKDNGSNFQTSNVLTGLTKGKVYVKVKDNFGCLSVDSTVTVGQPDSIKIFPAPYVFSDYNGRDIKCPNSSDGKIKIEASGGTSPLKYFDGGSFILGNITEGHIFSGLGAGNHTLTIQDKNGCTESSSPVLIVAPPAITGSVTPIITSCYELSDGRINLTSASGGTNQLSYALDNGSFEPLTSFPVEFQNLAAGSHTVKIKDANDCVTDLNTSVPLPLQIGVSGIPTLVTCSGGSDGSVVINATNAIGTPTYAITGVNGGAFQLTNNFTGLSANSYTLTVKDGNGCTGTGNVIVTSNPVITGGITVSTPISCHGGTNGALNLTPGGGVGPYTFNWSTGANTEDITGLAAGTYTVTITDSKLCQQNFNRNLTQPLSITVNPTPSDFNGVGVSCFGSNNGSINIAPAGGNGGYTYNWSTGATTEDITNLAAGNYTVTVTDSKSCTGNQTITITQPALLNTTTSGQNLLCFGGNTGSITLSTTGGTTNYEYSINGGTNWQSSPTFTNRTAGSYTILTRDANSCGDTDNITLTSPSNLVLTTGNTNTTCNQSNGTANASAIGGVTAYSFNWYNSSNANIGTGNTINNLAAGIYRVEVIDQNSCSKQQNVTISSSDGPSIITTSITGTTCSNTTDGTATINITQGQAPYTIHWPNNQTTETATNLAGGDYIVEVRDNTNCLALQTVTVPSPPELILQTITQQNPNCYGTADGQITINAQGGNGTYNYNWSNGSTSNSITNLTAGTYTVTLKDIKNCQAIQQYALTNPPIFTIDLGADEQICEGQTITKASAVENATYAWTGPNNFINTQQQISISEPGTYTLTVTNQNGCEATDSFTLSINTDLLKADFLMVSEAFAGDTVIVIDISWPIPTSVNWQFETGATVIDQSPDYALVRYDEPGTYNTTLKAQLAQCVSTYSQSLVILERPEEEESGKIGKRVFKTFHVYPNPVREKLTIEIELSEAQKIQLEVYHLNSNKRELSQVLSDNSHYETEVNLTNFEAGLYVVAVRAGNELKSVKVIKL